MNIAEYVRDSFPAESYLLRRACLIKAQVEAASLEFREDVVKEGISIGKVHDTSDWDDEQVRCELFVLLQQGISLARGGGCDACSVERREPDGSGWLPPRRFRLRSH